MKTYAEWVQDFDDELPAAGRTWDTAIDGHRFMIEKIKDLRSWSVACVTCGSLDAPLLIHVGTSGPAHRVHQHLVETGARPIGWGLPTEIKTFYVILRVKSVSIPNALDIGSRVLVPLWWRIDALDGASDAAADGAYSITICEIPARNLVDAKQQFVAEYGFFAKLLDGVESLDASDWTGRLDDFAHAERMTDFWAARAKAIAEGKVTHERPPRHDYKPQIGDRVRIGLSVLANVRSIAPNGAAYEIELDDRGHFGDRCVLVEKDEILGCIDVGGFAPEAPLRR